MIELNFEQLDLVSGGDDKPSGLTSLGQGDWQVYTGPLPSVHTRIGRGNKSILMQSDGSDGDTPRPAGWGG